MNNIHHDLLITRDLVYGPSDFTCTEPIAEAESAEYGAYAFMLNGFNIRFRVAKITPTKIGQFVTVWKRIERGPIQPYDASDPVDFFIISTRQDNNFGQFIFPKTVLIDKNIFSKNQQGGKRGIRVYPPWDKTTSQQAKKTQQWQLNYFLEIRSDIIDVNRAHSLYLAR